MCCDNMCCMALQCRLDMATCCPQLCAPDAFCGINGTCMCVPICMKCIATNECDCGALPCPEFCTPYVVFERGVREFNLSNVFQSFYFFMFQLRHSNHKNITCIAYSYHKKITQKSTLEYPIDHDENSNINARTQVRCTRS